MNTKTSFSFFTFSFMLLLVSSCSSAPKLYPNTTYAQNGEVVAKRDVSFCMEQADKYLDSSEGKKLLKSTGFGAAVGGAMGAVTGAFYGNIAEGAARGAAIGGAGGAVSGSLSPNELKQRYVNRCLQEKGYEVIGWD